MSIFERIFMIGFPVIDFIFLNENINNKLHRKKTKVVMLNKNGELYKLFNEIRKEILFTITFIDQRPLNIDFHISLTNNHETTEDVLNELLKKNIYISHDEIENKNNWKHSNGRLKFILNKNKFNLIKMEEPHIVLFHDTTLWQYDEKIVDQIYQIIKQILQKNNFKPKW